MLYFSIYQPAEGETLATQWESLEAQVNATMRSEGWNEDYLVATRLYLSDAANQEEFVREQPFFKDFVSVGALSVIEQPPTDGSKVALQMVRADRPADAKELHEGLSILTFGEIKLIFHSVRFTEAESLGKTSQEQTEEAFRRHITLLLQSGMTLKDNCQRTWLFVRDIDRNYNGVVAGRNHIFAQEGLNTNSHFIASTGIGACPNHSATVAADFLSVKGVSVSAVAYLQALEYLNPTKEYGVAFERGTRISAKDADYYLISGTASIDKYGEVLHEGDVLTQTGRLFLNIEKLLEDGGATLADMQYAIVYLRDIADAPAVHRYMRLRFPSLPVLVVEARVCRPKWLIEAECLARK